MASPRKNSVSDTEVTAAASSLFEIGIGVLRGNDKQMAKTLIGVAEKLWENASDTRNAKKARELYQSM
jgi:hypothetical protein